MKVLITGATGLVGSEIVRLCKKEGIFVHYLTTNKQKLQLTESMKGFYWDPKSDDIDEACIDGVDRIIHLAGGKHRTTMDGQNKARDTI